MRLQFHCTIEGVGVDPDDPPLQWEAYDGTTWHACEVGEDTTGGLNRDGSIIVHVPRQHSATLLDGERGRLVARPRGRRRRGSALVQCVANDPRADRRHHRRHRRRGPRRRDRARDRWACRRAWPARRSRPRTRRCCPPSDTLRLLVTSDDGWEEWTEVEHFADSSPTDHHFMLDAVHGVISFGPAVREADGSLRQYGAVPPKGAIVQIDAYATGGGRIGNVGAGSIRTLKSSIPFIAGVENRGPATGGVDGEDLESAKTRGPILLRTRNRAVTAEDFEQLTRAAAPEIARVKCLPAGEGADAGQRAHPGRARRADRRRADPLRGPRAAARRRWSGSSTRSTAPAWSAPV